MLIANNNRCSIDTQMRHTAALSKPTENVVSKKNHSEEWWRTKTIHIILEETESFSLVLNMTD